MSEFKVGDKVKLISRNPRNGFGGAKIGDVGTITRIDGDMVMVGFENHEGWRGCISEIELIKEEPQVIKACELMVEAQKNPAKYEGKKYKSTFWDILDGYGKSHKEIIVKNGRLHFTNNDNLKVYIGDSNELEEIKPEPKPVTFMEAMNSEKLVSCPERNTYKCRPDWILSNGSRLTLKDINGTWYIEE